MKRAPVTLLIAPGLLVMAVALVLYGHTITPKASFDGRLRDLLPPPPPGWSRQERPIADTPEMQKAVGELLNYDDGSYVVYESSTGDTLSAYLAYWKPGKMSPRLVAGHTPDVCWVSNGWRAVDRKVAFTLPRGDQPDLPSARWGIYELKGTTQHVVFWHVYSGKSAETTADPSPWRALFRDIANRGLDQRGEQFFIRLSSNRPIEHWNNWPVYRSLISTLAPHIGKP